MDNHDSISHASSGSSIQSRDLSHLQPTSRSTTERRLHSTYYAKSHSVVKTIHSTVKLAPSTRRFEDLTPAHADAAVPQETEENEYYVPNTLKDAINSTRWKMAGQDVLRRMRLEGEQAGAIREVKPFSKPMPLPPQCRLFDSEAARPLKDALKNANDFVVRKPVHSYSNWLESKQGASRTDNSLHLERYTLGYPYDDIIHLDGGARHHLSTILLPTYDAQTAGPVREEWLAKVLERHPEVAELRQRLYPLQRAIELSSSLHGNEAIATQHSEIQITEDTIARLIMQHLLYEGLRESKQVLERELGTEYQLLDAEGSMLHEFLKDTIYKSEKLYDLVCDQSGKFGAEEDRIQMIQDHLLHVLGIVDPHRGVQSHKDMKMSLWDEPDELNIVFKHGSRTSIAACSLNALIKAVTAQFYSFSDAKASAKQLLDILCETFESFTTSSILMRKLVYRFEVPESERRQRKAVQMMVLAVLTHLMRNHYEKFANADIRWLLYYFEKSEGTSASQTRNGTWAPGYDAFLKLDELKRAIDESVSSEQRRYQRLVRSVLHIPPPHPEIPKSIFSEDLTIFDVPSIEIARQMTLISFEVFSRIETVELLGLAWSKPKLKHRAFHLLQHIQRFNDVTRWIVYSVLEAESRDYRLVRLTKFVEICHYLRYLKNFDALQAILSGLRHAAMTRMKYLWGSLDKYTNETLASLRQTMDPSGSFKQFRAELLRAMEHGDPCIPYLGVFMSDVTLIEEGNDDLIDNPHYKTLLDVVEKQKIAAQAEEQVPVAAAAVSTPNLEHVQEKLINLRKREMIVNVFKRIRQLYSRPFNFVNVHQIQVLCWDLGKSIRHMTDERLLELSAYREPSNQNQTEATLASSRVHKPKDSG